MQSRAAVCGGVGITVRGCSSSMAQRSVREAARLPPALSPATTSCTSVGCQQCHTQLQGQPQHWRRRRGGQRTHSWRSCAKELEDSHTFVGGHRKLCLGSQRVVHKHNLKQGSREAGVCISSSSPTVTRMSSSCAQRASIMASLANELVCRGACTCVNGEHEGIADNVKKVATNSPANKAAAMNVQQARRSNCVCSHGGCVRGGSHSHSQKAGGCAAISTFGCGCAARLR